MERKIKRVLIHDLTPGMVLAKEISNGNIKLLEEGVILTSKLIKKIQTTAYEFEIYIYDDMDEEYIPKIVDESVKKLKEKEELFEEFSKKLEKMFSNLKANRKVNMKEVREFESKMLCELGDWSLIIRSVVNDRSIEEYENRHCINVSVLSYMLGKWLKLPQKDVISLSYAGLLHDIGKLMLDEKILNKNSKLTSKEFYSFKKHPVIGYEILKQVPYVNESILFGVLMHHERSDGKGYPLKLKNEGIRLFGKIIAITDSFDKITSNRLRKSKKSIFEALEKMQKESFEKYDYHCWIVFLKNVLEYCVGENVKLSSGDIGKIIKVDVNNISKPLIMVNGKFIDLKNEKDIKIIDMI